MNKKIDYYYGMLSPFAFLGFDRLLSLSHRTGTKINFLPTDFIDRVFARTGGLKLHERSEARQAYRLAELERWSKHLGIKINLKPKHFPVADELAARFAIAAIKRGLDAGMLSRSILAAVWQQERDVADPATLRLIADGLGMDGASLLSEAQAPNTLEALEGNCDAAVKAGVFGTPAYVYEGQVFWGQDRLEFLEAAILKSGS